MSWCFRVLLHADGRDGCLHIPEEQAADLARFRVWGLGVMHKATTAIINLIKVLLADLLNPMILQVGLDTRTSLKLFGASIDYETCCTSLQQDVHRYLDPEHEGASPQPHPFCTNYLRKPMLSAGSSLARHFVWQPKKIRNLQRKGLKFSLKTP